MNGSDGQFVLVYGSNWELVLVNGCDWELVDVDGSDGQVVALWLESALIGHPRQSEFLAFGGDPVRGSLVGVAVDFLLGFITVVVHFGDDELLLFLCLFTGRVVRLGVAIRTFGQLEKKREDEKVTMTHFHWLLPSKLRSSDWLVTVISGYL